jgi:fumarate hydratase class I
VIYYVGPVDPVRDEVVGPAGPTTATRMDKFTDMMLDRPAGHASARPSAARRPPGIANHKSAYLMAVGGAAYLVPAPSRNQGRGFADLGMEAIYEFTVRTCR